MEVIPTLVFSFAYKNHILQTNTRHREEEQRNIYSNEKSERRLGLKRILQHKIVRLVD